MGQRVAGVAILTPFKQNLLNSYCDMLSFRCGEAAKTYNLTHCQVLTLIKLEWNATRNLRSWLLDVLSIDVFVNEITENVTYFQVLCVIITSNHGLRPCNPQ